MWCYGAIVVAYPFVAYAAYRLHEKWENRAVKIRQMVNTRNETLAHRRYFVAGCDMSKI
jgi:putative SOS response-associated peptidase YedK